MEKVIEHILNKQARVYPEHPMVVWEDITLSYMEVLHRSDDLAAGLLDIGIKKGDTVTTWTSNVPEWIIMFFALAKIGAINVPANTRFKTSEIEYTIRHSDSCAVLLMNKFLDIDFPAILDEVVPGFQGTLPGQLNNERAPLLRHIICTEEGIRGTWSLKDLELRGHKGNSKLKEKLLDAKSQVSPEDPVMYQYTSGTTGFPKGAILCQGPMVQNGYFTSERLAVTHNSRWFSAMPFYHVGGSIWGLMTILAQGASLITQSSFAPEEALRLLDEYQCTHQFGVDTMFISEMEHPKFDEFNIYLDVAVATGSESFLQKIKSKMHVQAISNMWGLTETTGNVTLCDIYQAPLEKQLTTVGKPHKGYEVKVVDPQTGKPLSLREKGELCVRGPMVMKEYYKMPEETAKAIDADGWFHSGDIGYCDDEGYYYFVGRIKDIIKVGGENVAAPEVESYLMSHPKVKLAQIVGVPDPRLSEVCLAYVELKDGRDATEQEIIDFCKGSIANFKVPRYVFFINSSKWPMTGSGKIQKFALRNRAIEALKL